MARKLPVALQVQKLEDRCYKFNPEDDCTIIDWKHVVDPELTYSENLEVLKSEYPGFGWEKPKEPPVKEYEEMVIDGLRAEAEPYSYDIIKGYKLEALQRDSRRAERLGEKLEICNIELGKPRKTKPGVCKRRSVKVDSHYRCPPRR